MNSKRYTAFIIFIIISQLSCEKSYIEPSGLLDGFSFETAPLLFSSFFQRADDYDLSWTNEDAFDGEHSLKMKSTNLENQSFALWNLNYRDYEMGKPFKIKVRVKTVDLEGSGGAQVNMFARSKDGTTNLSSSIGDLVNSTDGKWETIELSLDANPSNIFGAIDIYFLLTPGSTGTVYWDKLEIFTGE